MPCSQKRLPEPVVGTPSLSSPSTFFRSVMTRSFWQHRGRPPALTCDVAIVGAGIAGASAAFWLRKARPNWTVALLDAVEPGHGASGRNAGFLLQGIATDYVTDIARYGRATAQQLWHFTLENRELLEKELDPAAFNLQRTGSLIVAGSAAEDERLQQSVMPLRADGVPVAYVPPQEVSSRAQAGGLFGALNVPSGATCDPLKLVRHIIAQSDATVCPHHRVIDLIPQNGSVHLITPHRTVVAGQVLVTTNAAPVPGLVRPQGAIRPVRAQMLATAPLASRVLSCPVYSHEGNYYLRQLSGGEVLLGGARHQHAAAEVGFADATTPPVQDALEAYLQRHFPWAAGAQVQRRWSGTMGFTADRLPIIGSVPDAPGSYWAGGFHGHGMGMAFRFGKLLAAMVAQDVAPNAAALFRADRPALTATSATVTESTPRS